MNRLLKIGFQEVGKWQKGNNKSGIDFNLYQHNKQKQILYAFISGETVYYIGKSDNTLETRMNGYKNAGGSQRTNIRVQAELKKLLNEEKVVKIYVLVDNSNYEHKGIKIRLSAGLEDNLIMEIKPEWNYRSNKKIRIKELAMEMEREEILIEINQSLIVDESKSQTFDISTNELKNSRINFPKKEIDYSLLPEFNTLVIVFLGKESELFFEAKLIDSSNGKNGSARINSALLNNWYEEENLSLQDTFKLDIINKTTFRIYK